MSDNITDTYDIIAPQYAAAFDEPTDFIDDFLALLPSRAHLLDLGCGPGVELAHCTQKGFEIDGIDLSDNMLAHARLRAPNAKIAKADIRNFKGDAPYDAILASYSLIHIKKDDVLDTLHNIKDNLCPGGFVYIAFHEGPCGHTTIAEPFNPKLKIFLNIFSEDEMKNLLSQTGFEILKIQTRPPANADEFAFNKCVIFAKRNER